MCDSGAVAGFDQGSTTRFTSSGEAGPAAAIDLVDTLGLLLHAIVHPVDIQNCDGGVLVMATLFGIFPFLKTLFADGEYQGPQFAKAIAKVLAAFRR